MPPRVFIIILQHNNTAHSLRCLESVRSLDYRPLEVVVVDNASNEEEKDRFKNHLKNRWPGELNVHWLENEKNWGYAGGNNRGIDYALKQGAEYIWILNNDTATNRNVLKRLVQIMQNQPQLGLVSPALKEDQGRMVYFGKISWLKPELVQVEQPPVNEFLKPKEYIPGTAVLIRKEVFEKIGFFDEIYFLYFEDADFCFRAQLAGYKLKVAPEVIVRHQVSASTSKLGAPLLLRYHLRNALIFNSLNAPWTIKPFLIFWSGYVLAKNFLKMFLWPDAREISEAIIEGVLDFYRNKFGVITTVTPN